MSSFFLDDNVLNYSFDVSNKVRIGPVEGVLKEPLQFTVEANWENIFNVGGSIISNIQKFTNGGALNAGIWTRKFYKGGSYLRINPKMRVVNWDGTGDVVHQARLLTDLALPAYKGKSIERVVSDLKNVGLGKVLDDATEGLSSLISQGDLASVIHKTFDELGSNSPKPVDVVVSNFFKNQFIVESVQVEFSREMTPQGPLYADFDISLSTPEVTIRGGTGLKIVKSKFIRE